MDDPYNVYGGMQDHDSWKGPSNSWSGEVNVADWITVGDGRRDVQPRRSRPTRAGSTTRAVRRPQARRPEAAHDDRHHAAAAEGPAAAALELEHRRSRSRRTTRRSSTPAPRCCCARSTAATRGRRSARTSRPTTRRRRSAGATSSSARSRRSPSRRSRPGVIWMGTDDGKVQVTRTHGADWTDVTAAIAKAGGPADRWVSRVFASSHDAGTAFVAKNGFRHDDFKPYLFKTTDYGATWTSIVGGPARSADQRRLAGPHEPAPAVRRQRQGRVGVDRRRRALGADEGQHAQRAGARPARASARARPDRRHLRPGHLHHGRVGAAADRREACWRRTCTCSTSSRASPFQTSGWGNYDFYGDRYRLDAERAERHRRSTTTCATRRTGRCRSRSRTCRASSCARSKARLSRASTPCGGTCATPNGEAAAGGRLPGDARRRRPEVREDRDGSGAADW